ncbi:MAG: hypothetical protein KAJ10_11030 [Thermodesulfovibrionia bacterium]|jgi:hypothetical protein|nr:hypothetical protein [Thermodesulfovibrionia bacterium]
MKNRSVWRLLSVIIFAWILIGGIDQMTKSALKVKHILKKIETHRPLSKNKKLTAEVTKTELNAYIRYRLAQEKDPQINSLKII